MTISELLGHPLFIAFVGMLVAAFLGVLGFAFKKGVLSAISDLKKSVNDLGIGMESHGTKLTKFEVEIDDIKKDQEGTERSVSTIAGAVQKMLIALPTNYCTKDDLNTSTNKLSEKLDAIDNRLKNAPSREEIDRRLAEMKK